MIVLLSLLVWGSVGQAQVASKLSHHSDYSHFSEREDLSISALASRCSINVNQVGSVTQLCQQVMDSRYCKDVKRSKRIQCDKGGWIERQFDRGTEFVMKGFRCGQGSVEAAGELISMMIAVGDWAMRVSNPWMDGGASIVQSKQAVVSAAQSTRSYFVAEYEEALTVAKAKDPNASALSVLGQFNKGALKDAFNLLEQLMNQAFPQFDCLNDSEKYRQLCRFLFPPAGLIGALKYGPKLLSKSQAARNAFKDMKADVAPGGSSRQGGVVLEGDEIPEDWFEEMLADLDRSRPPVEVEVTPVTPGQYVMDPRLRNPSDITASEVDSLVMLYGEEARANLVHQVQTRTTSVGEAERFAQSQGWQSTGVDSLVVRSDDFSSTNRPVLDYVPAQVASDREFGFREGWMQVQMHGNGGDMPFSSTTSGHSFSVEELADGLRRSGHTNQPVKLISCHSGCALPGQASPAQGLANALNAPVVAPSHAVQIIGRPTVVGPNLGGGRRAPTGEWRVYLPEGSGN